jgi:hypothetical protein
VSGELFAAIICALGWVSMTFFFFAQGYVYEKERKALLDRIMARDWDAYRVAQQPQNGGEVRAVSDEEEKRIAEAWAAEQEQQLLNEEEHQGVKLEFN